ncbi:hypothetical protein GCM10009740_23560 [Terrabacter terrae]|uniref:Uncharacterized protein n=1 Tax=Terrabacter terrae TaxID=318434 RepID=A0ABN2UAY4_9MICO
MTDNQDPRAGGEAQQSSESSVRRQPLAGTPEEQEPEQDAVQDAPHAPGDGDQDALEAQAADDFYHDRPAATSARVFDAEGNSGG